MDSMSNWTTDEEDSLQMEEDRLRIPCLLVPLSENLDSRKQETGDFLRYPDVRLNSPSDLRRMGDPLESKKEVEQNGSSDDPPVSNSWRRLSMEMDRRVGAVNKDLLVSEGGAVMIPVVELAKGSTMRISSS